MGETKVSQIQTLQPFDEVIEQWIDLKPKFLMKEKEKEMIGGRIHLKLYYSRLPETAKLAKDLNESGNIFLDNYLMKMIKTGDLIVYDGIGAIPALVKLNRNIPFSHLGLVIKLVNRWTRKDELFVLEFSRNVDQFSDAFSNKPDKGIILWPLKERIYQFYGSSMWWVPCLKSITKSNHQELIKYLEPLFITHKNLKKDIDESQLLKINKIIENMANELFGINKWIEICETATNDLIYNCLIKLGLVSENTKPDDIFPDDIVTLSIYGELYPLKQKVHAFSVSSLPPSMQKKFVEKESELLSVEQKIAFEKQQKKLKKVSVNSPTIRQYGEKMLLARESVLAFDMTQQNLFPIMIKGAKLMRFTQELKFKTLSLASSEDEIICGKQRIDLQDIDEIRLGLKSDHFDRYRKDLLRFESLSFSIMYGRKTRRSNVGFSLDFVANTPLEYKIWTVGLKHLLEQRDEPELALLSKTYKEMKLAKLNLPDVVRLIERMNLRIPIKFVAEKFNLMANQEGFLNYKSFLEFFKLLKHRTSISDIFNKYTNTCTFSKQNLIKFLKESQKVSETIIEEMASFIIQKFGKKDQTSNNKKEQNS